MSSIKMQKCDDMQRLDAIKSGRKVELPEFNGDNEEYIQLLQEFMDQSAEQCRFLEAESAKQKIEELRKQLNKSKHNEMKNKHNGEQEELENAHNEELQQFNIFWNEKMEEFNSQAQKMESELIQRHEEEKEQYRNELEEGLPKKAKDSNRLLDLKNQRDVLSRQKSFIDAHIVHIEIEKLEQVEQEQFEQERQSKIKNQINHLVQKQQQELNALRLKIKKGQEEQAIDRQTENERLLQKYKVVTKDVKNRQVNENNFMAKTFTNPGLNGSRFVNQSKFNQSKSNFNKK